MYRKITAIALIATILMSIVIPVQAITSGELDDYVTPASLPQPRLSQRIRRLSPHKVVNSLPFIC